MPVLPRFCQHETQRPNRSPHLMWTTYIISADPPCVAVYIELFGWGMERSEYWPIHGPRLDKIETRAASMPVSVEEALRSVAPS